MQERAYAKRAALLAGVVEALVARGVDGPTARLAAQVGAVVFDNASRVWGGDPTVDLGAQIARSAEAVRDLG